MNIRNKQGQSLIEYTTVIIIVMAVFLATGNYFKRGIQGRWKSAVDDLGEQYDPRTANSSLQSVLESSTNTDIFVNPRTDHGGFYTDRIDKSQSRERKTGTVKVGAY